MPRKMDENELDAVINHFKKSQNPREQLVGDELFDAVYQCYSGRPVKGAWDAIDRMDEFIRAARLARTKLRRLL